MRLQTRVASADVIPNDARERLIREDRPDGSVLRSEYDTNGNLTRITDANGNIMTREYDALNRLVRLTAPAPFFYVTPGPSSATTSQ